MPTTDRTQAAPSDVSTQPAKADAAAGRGGLALSLAKLYFLVLGLAQQIGLTWLIADSYGALRGALSPASITYNPLISAGVQGLSRTVSRAEPGAEPAAIRQGLSLHAAGSVLVASGFFIIAPWLGSWLGSEYLTPSFQTLAFAIFIYGLYAPLVGVLNGQRRFLLQAGLDMLAATLRTIGLLGGAWWYLDQGGIAAVEGAVRGFTASTLLMLLIATAIVGIGKGGTAPPLKEHLAFILPVLAGHAAINLLLQADSNTLRAFATREAVARGLPATAADPLIGAYAAGQLFAFLPYQLLIGLTFILFPMLTRAHKANDIDSVRRYVSEGNRTALLVTGAIVSASSGLAPSLLRFVFPERFGELGSESMAILTLGMGAFASFGVSCTVLNGLGRQWHSLAATVLGLVAVVSANLLLVPGTPFGSAMLVKTAVATSLGVLAAALAAGAAVQRASGTFVSPGSGVRIMAAVAGSIAVGRLLPILSRPLTVVAAAALICCYVALLLLMRELGSRDLSRLKALLR